MKEFLNIFNLNGCCDGKLQLEFWKECDDEDDYEDFPDETFSAKEEAARNAPKITGPSGDPGARESIISIDENTKTVHKFTADQTIKKWEVILFVDGNYRSGADKDLFDIDSNGILTFKKEKEPDYENPTDSDIDGKYVIEIRAINESDDYSYQKVTVTVKNVDESPYITGKPIDGPPGIPGASNIDVLLDARRTIIKENTTVATFTAAAGGYQDPVANKTVNWSLSGGTDLSKFEIDSQGTLTTKSPIDYVNPTDSNKDNIYVVIVQADWDGKSSNQTVTVTVEEDILKEYKKLEGKVLKSNGDFIYQWGKMECTTDDKKNLVDCVGKLQEKADRTLTTQVLSLNIVHKGGAINNTKTTAAGNSYQDIAFDDPKCRSYPNYDQDRWGNDNESCPYAGRVDFSFEESPIRSWKWYHAYGEQQGLPPDSQFETKESTAYENDGNYNYVTQVSQPKRYLIFMQNETATELWLSVVPNFDKKRHDRNPKPGRNLEYFRNVGRDNLTLFAIKTMSKDDFKNYINTFKDDESELSDSSIDYWYNIFKVTEGEGINYQYVYLSEDSLNVIPASLRTAAIDKFSEWLDTVKKEKFTHMNESNENVYNRVPLYKVVRELEKLRQDDKNSQLA